MDINKSSRHQEIVGKFGEQIVANWLSRSGWEVVLVNHTGIDIIAYHRKVGKRIGITVKSRTKIPRLDTDSVNIFERKNKDREKLQAACEYFACDPWIAIYYEKKESADLFLTSLANYDRKYCGKRRRAIDAWKMTKKYPQLYASDPEVCHIHFDFKGNHWQ
jgi:Holliday junction resolvase-like predicted endonuclease